MVSWAKFEGKPFSDPKCSGPLLQTLPLKSLHAFLSEDIFKSMRDLFLGEFENLYCFFSPYLDTDLTG